MTIVFFNSNRYVSWAVDFFVSVGLNFSFFVYRTSQVSDLLRYRGPQASERLRKFRYIFAVACVISGGSVLVGSRPYVARVPLWTRAFQ